MSDKKIVVYFDNVAPVINSMTPTAANLDSVEYALSETETLSGSVKDGLGLAKVELILGNNGEVVYSNTTHPAAWTIDVDTTQFYDAATAAAITAKGAAASTKYTGLYEVPFKVVATDLAGNTSDPISGTFYVNPDGSPAVDIAGQTPAINASIVYPNHPPSDAASIGTWEASSLAPRRYDQIPRLRSRPVWIRAPPASISSLCPDQSTRSSPQVRSICRPTPTRSAMASRRPCS